MKLTRSIALCALTLAIALAIGAISPYQPYASAGQVEPIFNSAPAHVVPTPALATAAPVVEQPAAPTPQVIYIQLPPLQVVIVQSPAAPLEAQQLDQPAAPLEAQQLDQPAAPLEAQQLEPANDYQQRRLDAINAGTAYRPRTR